MLEALVALHLHDPDISQEKDVAPSFPLSMSNLVRILGAEEDGAVLAVLLRIIRDVLHVSQSLSVVPPLRKLDQGTQDP